ncbi:H-NS histone family protein [Jannaschia rubra]|uniref:H-NS histone family protein n=1 Tax=Jannaschia rubra TaxID=282197 RepID=A0A0M6XT40_9RHOB|nr:H-NS histone family protein [Jannaschia rubra]CTQ33371.1 H-NS histone family protein [Jannaschia rubra]SFG00195.1 DNA-binding protein H-NS [Jannaschia rubra]
MNLEKMNREELLDLQKQVSAALKNYDDRQKKEAQTRLEAMARDMGYSLNDFVGGKKGGKSGGGVPKYVHPENPSKTWSGRGRQPQWFKDAIASGKSEKDLAI